MKRNEDRIWFDRGYSQAVSDRKIESFPARFTGIGFLVAISFFDPAFSAGIFIFWSILEYLEWRDEKKYGVDHEVPKTWEWQT